jgi:hypothetical protein
MAVKKPEHKVMAEKKPEPMKPERKEMEQQTVKIIALKRYSIFGSVYDPGRTYTLPKDSRELRNMKEGEDFNYA